MQTRKACPILSRSSQTFGKEPEPRHLSAVWPKAKQIKESAKRVEEILIAPGPLDEPMSSFKNVRIAEVTSRNGAGYRQTQRHHQMPIFPKTPIARLDFNVVSRLLVIEKSTTKCSQIIRYLPSLIFPSSLSTPVGAQSQLPPQ